MECNKDEAIRAKDIAVKKFTERDFAGAKKFALKAQTLYPGLEGISQMLTMLEVYISAETKIIGEMDMYGVLGVSPLADDETIKKHYRKLVLLLHPDKNKSIGADGAFQLVAQAFNFLSDKAKRAAYNNRRNIRATQQKVPPKSGVSATVPRPDRPVHQKAPTPGGVPGASKNVGKNPTDFEIPVNVGLKVKVPQQNRNSSGPSGVNGCHKHMSNKNSSRVPKKNSTQKPSAEARGVWKRKESKDTFWTACTRCKVQYEYVRSYLNQTLRCPHCQVGFVATEIPPPSNLLPIRRHHQHQKSSFGSGSKAPGFNHSSGDTTARWRPFVEKNASNGSNGGTACGQTQARSSNQMVNERLKRGLDELHSTARYGSDFGGENPLKKRREEDSSMRNYGNEELSYVELNQMLAEKAREEIQKNLKEWKAPRDARTLTKERQKSKVAKYVAMEDLVKSKLSSLAPSKYKSQEDLELGKMSIRDPEFHVFDSDRLGSSFGENQVWAAYDKNDRMPRYFAMIHEVISLNPFKVRFSWLNSKTNIEFSTLDWIGRGFVKTCGDFWIGKYETNIWLSSFSHRVKWVKGPRGIIQIYPQKGDIWALYRYWSPEWNENTPQEIKHVYEMVEVLDDYNEDRGVAVAPLIKASGFQTVFCKQPDPKQVKLIPKEEMFRFSHSVPSYVLTGAEKPNAPKGYMELDPAATPLELVQVNR